MLVTAQASKDHGNARLATLKQHVAKLAVVPLQHVKTFIVTVQVSKAHGNAEMTKLKKGVVLLALELELHQHQRHMPIKV